MIYLLGSRTFCTYVCPYGAIFALADRIAPGRIRVTDACQQCGTCTAACTTGIRVHEEVKRHGMIVNPSCMKDLDCVSACPQSALHYTFTRPALLKSFKSGGRFGSLPYDFTVAEELLAAFVFVVVLLSFRGLYSQIPFLLSLALGGIIGYLSVTTVRLFSKPNVVLATLRLRKLGRLTLTGRIFSGLYLLLAAFVGHSAFVRYHEYTGLRQALALPAATTPADADILAAGAFAHLTTSDRFGLLRNERVERAMLTAASRLGRLEQVERYATRVLERHPGDIGVRVQLARAYVSAQRPDEAEPLLRDVVTRWVGDPADAPAAVPAAHQALGGLLAQRGDYAGAAQHLRTAIIFHPKHAETHAELGGALAELGLFDEAIASLTEAVQLDPSLAGAQYNLGTLLGHLGRFEEAIPHYESALRVTPDDAELRNNLGHALLRTGRLDQSRQHLERSLVINPNGADAHFNLGAVLAARQQPEQAAYHYAAAARLDPRYARLLDSTQQK
jgi:tetratricopeptide (TPR) repeat protein/NAD-dependent dihydropyrimidine dehydrogenase PreA subunit